MYTFMCQCIHVYLYVCIHYMNVHMYVQYMYDHSPSLLNYLFSWNICAAL
jgi:hypothetical protein